MLRGLKDIEQCVIGATDGDIGQVRDIYFDDHAWVVRYLIVDTGSWLSGRSVLISPISLQKPDWAAHRLPAAITQDQVRHSPDIDTDKAVSRQHETQLLGYYGYPSYWGATGIWGAGMLPYAMYPGYSVPAGDRFELHAGPRVEREMAIDQVAHAERARHLDEDPNLRSCKAVIGYHIHATDGEVGHVEGFLMDDETWSIRYLVVNTSNWWLGHKVLIAPQWIDSVHWSDQTVSVDLSREAVKAAPHYDPSEDLSRQHETDLYSHHGRASYWKAGSALERDI